MSDNRFNSKSVCKLTHISLRKLNYWVSEKLVVPSVSVGTGRGKRRLFNFVDVVQIRTIAFLRDCSVPLQNIRSALSYLNENFPEFSKPLAELTFLTNGKDTFVLCPTLDDLEKHHRYLINASKGGQIVHTFKLGKAVEELREDARQLLLSDKKLVVVAGQEYTIEVEPDPEDGGYVASCLGLLGCHSQGETKVEALQNIKQAITDWLAVKQTTAPRTA